MIKNILFFASFLLFSIFVDAETKENTEYLTDAQIASISQRLESYSTDQLVDRRNFLMKALKNEDEDEDEIVFIPPAERPAVLFEISVIEQLLILAGIVLADTISSETSTPPDSVSPVITVLGDNPATVELGDVYTDAGATADTGETVVTSGVVDTNTVGAYTLTYTATDAAGNTGTATRTVNVVDTTSPDIIINGVNPVTIELGSVYEDAGATVTDLDSFTLTTDSDVDTSAIGTYSVIYTATDASGNSASETRTVFVEDTTAPVITSPSSFSVEENQTSIGTVEVTDAGNVTFSVTGSDNIVIDENGILSFITAPDFETQAEYTITVTVTDESGNTVEQVITIIITNDPDDDDDDTGTGTGTGTSTGTGTGTGTS
tara:strand:- start:1921 stop:3051 length:1131 start_codon:yes stop_codon:yes gene_type:complete